MRLSYLWNGNSYTCKIASLHWTVQISWIIRFIFSWLQYNLYKTLWQWHPTNLHILTHLPLVLQICVDEWYEHWFSTKPLSKLIFIHENLSENTACKMATILSKGRLVHLNYMMLHSFILTLGNNQSAVWYKTKFGSQNFGYQLWCLFCNISNVLKNMFNVGLILMW